MSRSSTRKSSTITRAGAAVATLTLAVITMSSLGYDRYNNGCNQCHGDFFGPVSPQGTVFPQNSKHEMHRATANMDADCMLCHVAPGNFDNPFIGSSFGTANNPGVGCVGCHGRDYGGTIGNSGVGLRKHHENSGVTVCLTCHPNDPDALPENVKPTYYGTPDTKADDPCNGGPSFLENWSVGDTVGLDNDGNLLYDGDDPACQTAPPCVGDLNDDAEVNGADLGLLLGSWGQSGPSDLNGDGTTDGADLGLLLAAWGPCP